MPPPLLQIQNLSVQFTSGATTTTAVDDVSLTVNRGEIVALVGESGSGKSVTSLSILQLLPSPPASYPQGKILFACGDETVDLLTLSTKALQLIRGQKVAMIFQEPMSSLNPVMRCGAQVAEALLAHSAITKAEAKRQAIAWFAKVKLPHPAAMYNRYPHQLSGGQKQRVMIAMAMCGNPDLLICDEPTTALDVTVQQAILDLIKELQQERAMGVIFITHDLGVVARIASRVAIMYKGRIVEEGNTEAIFNAPKQPYTQALIACRPSANSKGKPLPTIADFMGDEVQKKPAHINQATPTAASSETLVTVNNLVVRYPVKTNFFGKVTSHFTAVDDVSFEVKKNSSLGLVGESGCGKTTMGRTLLRLIEPTSGTIFYNDRNITALSSSNIRELRKDVQLVFQDPFSSLNPRLTIGAAIAEPMQVHGIGASARERRKKVSELLDKISLPQAAAGRYPHQFSGGQRQRIVIARALGLSPRFLVCDESVSALDVSVQAQVLNLLNELKKDLGLTLLFISHNLSVVRYMCDEIMVMQAGRIVESGHADEVYLRPQSRYTKSLLQAEPAL